METVVRGFENISVEAGHGPLDSRTSLYIIDAVRWIEGELLLRDEIAVKQSTIARLCCNGDMNPFQASLQAAVYVLVGEYNATQEWYPDGVPFFAIQNQEPKPCKQPS